MKRFLIVLRNAGAFFCIGAVVVISMINVMSFLGAVRTSCELAYTTARTAMWMNFALVPIAAIANALIKIDVEMRVNFMAFSCIGGVFSSWCWAILVLISGVFSGHVLMGFVLFVAALYGSLAIYCLSVHFVHKIRGDVREFDTKCGCCHCEEEF